MKDKLDKIENKIDKIEEHLGKIDVTLGKQHEQLAHHIYRTNLAETNISMLREEIKPVKKHVALVDAGLKILGAVSAVTAFALGVYEAFIAR
jgi:archaellum component FlaC